MYTDAQKRSHIFDLQTFLRRIQQSEGSAAPLVPDGIFGCTDRRRCARIPAAALPSGDGHRRPAHMERHLRFICRAYRRRCTSHADGVLPAGERYRAEAGREKSLGVCAPAHAERNCAALQPDCRRAAHRRIRQRIRRPLSGGRSRSFSCRETGLTDRATWQALAGLHNALFRRTPLGWSMKE